MSRIITVALICAIPCTVATAEIDIPVPTDFTGLLQMQAHLTEITNKVDIAHGDHGTNTTSVDVSNQQTADNVHHILADQYQDVFLMEVGNAWADSGSLLVIQEIGSAGSQGQLIGGGIATKVQMQNLGLGGEQTILKAGGEGSGDAFQVGAVGQGQTGTNAAGTLYQGSYIDSMQSSGYSGSPGTVGLVNSTVNAGTSQSQVTF